MEDGSTLGSGQHPITYQRLCDRISKLESDNLLLKEQVASLSAELLTATTSISARFQSFSDTFTTNTAGLQTSIRSVISQLEELDSIKEQQASIAAKHSSLVSETELKVKSWASLCSNADSQPLTNINKMMQGKFEDERLRRVRELNLRVRGLPSTHDPLAAGRSFLCDQLGLADITVDRCWFGHGDVLFIRFLSIADRLRALRAKRMLFSTKIFLDEDLTKVQVMELKHARKVVADARRDGKWAVIRNLKAVIRDSAPSGWKERQAPKAK